MISAEELQDIGIAYPSSISNTNLPISQSRNLPNWLWVAIAKSLGIKLQDTDKPVISCIFYTLTYSSCFGLVITTFWFTVYDIISDYTKTTIIDGTIRIIYTMLWCALGIYAHKLSFRLFSHPHFFKLVKLHSKTILKMNAAILLFLLMTLFVLINNLNAYRYFESDVCQTVGVEIIVCKLNYVFRILYSICALLWNYLVAFALTSVCRSHVIRIRKFMKVLEQDAATYEQHFLGLTATLNNTPLEEYSWLEENYLEELHDEAELIHRVGLGPSSTSATDSSGNAFLSSGDQSQSSGIVLDSSGASDVPRRKAAVTPALSNDEILFNYWKVQTDLRISSVALQRWMISVISLVAIWLTLNLVMWLNYDPNLVDLLNFFLPLLLLPLFSSAYAEVNQEGQRLLKFICLTESRLRLLLVLQSCPLQMTLYSYGLSYKTIATASFGVLVALASKILIQKVFG